MATRSSRRDEAPAVRRATNVSLDMKLVESAREYGINISRACEQGLGAAIAEAGRKRWLEENAASIAASNAWVAEHGLPLEEYRVF